MMYEFLRKIPMFADLTEADLNALCEQVEEVHLDAGQMLFDEGSSGDRAYVIKDGELEVIKASGNREVLLAVRHTGEVIGEMALLQDAPRMAGVRARTPATLLAIHHDQLDDLLRTSPTAARAMLHTITARWRVTEALLRQSEKMAQLGTLTAGVAHELNNPSAAVQRGSGQLKQAVEHLQQLFLQPGDLAFTAEQRELLRTLDNHIQHRAENPVVLDPLACSDLEYEIEGWLDERGVENGWELAPTLASLNYTIDRLNALAEYFSPEQLPTALRWLTSTYTVYSLLESVSSGAARISEIVNSLKTYVFLDQAPVQHIDVHEGLESTIGLLRHKIKPGVTIRREYIDDLPRILAYGSELNQVWTNLLDNALDAVGEQGEIVLRTCREDSDWIAVEVEDSGPGIPEAIQSRVFDPFFTTKPPGHGSGMGLSVAYNVVNQKQRGEIRLYSRPGKTVFRVRLPLNFEAVQSENVAASREASMDAEIRRILDTTNTIAVVGISGDMTRPAYQVPAYLQNQGYRIIPVNPKLDHWNGQRAFPDLTAVNEPVDTVLIFRAGEHVPPIVDQAVAIGARTVWMQEGIVNETAARVARDAGLQVVMDACMRVQHQRLVMQPRSA